MAPCCRLQAWHMLCDSGLDLAAAVGDMRHEDAEAQPWQQLNYSRARASSLLLSCKEKSQAGVTSRFRSTCSVPASTAMLDVHAAARRLSHHQKLGARDFPTHKLLEGILVTRTMVMCGACKTVIKRTTRMSEQQSRKSKGVPSEAGKAAELAKASGTPCCQLGPEVLKPATPKQSLPMSDGQNSLH